MFLASNLFNYDLFIIYKSLFIYFIKPGCVNFNRRKNTWENDSFFSTNNPRHGGKILLRTRFYRTKWFFLNCFIFYFTRTTQQSSMVVANLIIIKHTKVTKQSVS